MTTVHFAIPGDLDTPTGGYAYDRQVLELLPTCGVDARHLPLPGSFPFPSEADMAETVRLLAAAPAGDVLLIDGLAHGVLPAAMLASLAAPVVAMHHHPLGLETGLSEADSRRLLALEAAALAQVRHVIVSSHTTAATLRELRMVGALPVTVAVPGIAELPRAEGRYTAWFRQNPPHLSRQGRGQASGSICRLSQPSPLVREGGEAEPSRVRGDAGHALCADETHTFLSRGESTESRISRASQSAAIPGEGVQSIEAPPPFQILSVGSIIPRKGYDILIEAFTRLPRGAWRSTIAGSLELDPACVVALKAQIADADLSDHITLTGALKNLAPHYASADIYCLPSRYEGYGMAFASALASGLPVIAARAGAVPETVPPHAGILVRVDDADALAEALMLVMTDHALRQRLSDAAWTHGQTLPLWHDTAAIIARVAHDIAAGVTP